MQIVMHADARRQARMKWPGVTVHDWAWPGMAGRGRAWLGVTGNFGDFEKLSKSRCRLTCQHWELSQIFKFFSEDVLGAKYRFLKRVFGFFGPLSDFSFRPSTQWHPDPPGGQLLASA